MKMTRLIDAESLLNQYELIDGYSVSKKGQLVSGATTEDNPFIHYYDGEGIIKNAPTVDAVEVIRCRECKYRFGNNGHSKNGCPIIDANIWMDDDDFCSHGERKEGAD